MVAFLLPLRRNSLRFKISNLLNTYKIIDLNINLCKLYGCNVHILSNAQNSKNVKLDSLMKIPLIVYKNNINFCHTSHANSKSEIDDSNTLDARNSKLQSGPNLSYFLSNLEATRKLTKRELKQISHPYIEIKDISGKGKKVFFEVYGCQMNVSDTEIAWAILKLNGYETTSKLEEADVILIMTCAIREGAESKIWNKLKSLRRVKKKRDIKVGVLGCMAERLKTQLIEKGEIVDLVAGPDSYKDLPRLLAIADSGDKSVNVLLSHDETYANVKPVSLSQNRVSAFVSIMRGCDNMCTFCIVPYTRGKERSRDIHSITEEIRYLSDLGIKQVTLLGQNVNSYRDLSEQSYSMVNNKSLLSKGFKTVYKPRSSGRGFADLLDKVSTVDPEMRIRFTSPHPKDFPDEVLHVINNRPNICKCIHMPAQSGNNRILELMRRGYTRESYLDLVDHIRSIIPSINLTSDFICGFCGETDEEFTETLTLLQQVEYTFCYTFAYSMREKTAAHRTLNDSVPQKIKVERVEILHEEFRKIALKLNLREVGKHHLVLVEGPSRRSNEFLAGRNDGNIKVVLPDVDIPVGESNELCRAKPGDYVNVLITDASSQTLKGNPVKITTLTEYFS